jgi:altronate hydrolase
VASEIALPFRAEGVQVAGFSGCYPNVHAHHMLERLCTHANVGAALLVSLGCECFDRQVLRASVSQTGRPVETVIIQETGGTLRAIDVGRRWVSQTLEKLRATPRVAMRVSDLVVGALCGGSDATSGLTANPAIGRCFDLLVEEGAASIFEEPGELIGCESALAGRAATPQLAREIRGTMTKTERYYRVMGHGSFSTGNADGGLTTIEEKSMGSYAKSGSAPISGLLKPGVMPPGGGLYMLDVVPDGEPRFGYPNINDSAEITELIACGSHLILFSTGRGSVVGSVVAPVIKICANPETYRHMKDDMDVNAGRILEGDGDLDSVGREVRDRVVQMASGAVTKSEALGHQEFVLTYKTFEPLGPQCLPGHD